MKPMTRNLLLSLLALLSAALIAFAFVRASAPVLGAGGGTFDKGDVPAPPALPGESMTAGEDDAPITDPKITAGDDTASPDPFGGEGRREGADRAPERDGRPSDTLLPMILASVGSALFAIAVSALIVTNRKKQKEKFTSGGKSDDTDLPVRTD